MTIIRKPHTPASRPGSGDAAQAFIDAAPDGAKDADLARQAGAKGITQGHQRQISLALPPSLLARADKAARSLSISRAAYMKAAITKQLAADGFAEEERP